MTLLLLFSFIRIPLEIGPNVTIYNGALSAQVNGLIYLKKDLALRYALLSLYTDYNHNTLDINFSNPLLIQGFIIIRKRSFMEILGYGFIGPAFQVYTTVNSESVSYTFDILLGSGIKYRIDRDMFVIGEISIKFIGTNGFNFEDMKGGIGAGLLFKL